jgi:hypothetical protein
MLMAAGCQPSTNNPPPPTSKTIDAGTSADALPPTPKNPLPDAARQPEADPVAQR